LCGIDLMISKTARQLCENGLRGRETHKELMKS
jgi:hypothetical protein